MLFSQTRHFLHFIAYNLKQMRVKSVSIRVPSRASEAAHSGLFSDVVSQSAPAKWKNFSQFCLFPTSDMYRTFTQSRMSSF